MTDVARGTTTSTTYDDAGRVLTQTDAAGEVTTSSYDDDGSLATRTNARTHATAYARTPTTSTVTDLLARATTSSSSSYGLPVATTFEGGASQSTAFRGRTGFDASTSFPTLQTDESSRQRQFTYDAQSVLQSVTDLGGNDWSYGHTVSLGGTVSYDVQGGSVSLVSEGARSPVSQYGGRSDDRDAPRPAELEAWTDRLTEVESPEGEVTSWTFDATGNAVQVDYPYGAQLTRTIGADLRVATETLPFGTTLTFARDASGRVTARTGTDGSSHSFTYGERDRIATMTDGTGTTTYAYDTVGRFSGLDYPTGSGFEQGYDVREQVDAVRVHGPGASPTVYESTYTYDANGNLSTVTDPFGRTTTYTYDAADQLTEVLRPNGVRTTRTYDDRGWVASIVHTDASSAVLASVAYIRSPSGEPTRITREDGSYVVVGYDGALRVERERYYDSGDVLEEEIAYTYDGDGNRTSRTTSAGTETYVYLSGSRLDRVERGGATIADYEYDSGARTTRIERGGQDLALSYDADDRTVAIEDAVSTVRREYDFDAAGRRTGRRRLVGGVLAAALTMVAAPGLASGLDSSHLDVDGAGAPQTGYVFDGEHALARYDAGTTEPVYYLRDGMGSVIGVVDSAGTSSGRIHYDGFGNERRSDGALAALPAEGGPRFQGMWLEPSGLYYVRARVYEAESGRFLSRDQARQERPDPERVLSFGYARQNPNLHRDPTGLTPTNAADASAGAIASRFLTTMAFRALGNLRLIAQATRSLATGSGLLRAWIVHRHHVIPLFVQGVSRARQGSFQALYRMPAAAHQAYHSILHRLLLAEGLPASNMGSQAWYAYLRANPGAQTRALQQVLNAARVVDLRFGAELVRLNNGVALTEAIWTAVYYGRYFSFT